MFTCPRCGQPAMTPGAHMGQGCPGIDRPALKSEQGPCESSAAEDIHVPSDEETSAFLHRLRTQSESYNVDCWACAVMQYGDLFVSNMNNRVAELKHVYEQWAAMTERVAVLHGLLTSDYMTPEAKVLTATNQAALTLRAVDEALCPATSDSAPYRPNTSTTGSGG